MPHNAERTMRPFHDLPRRTNMPTLTNSTQRPTRSRRTRSPTKSLPPAPVPPPPPKETDTATKRFLETYVPDKLKLDSVEEEVPM